jgi:AcrR family transcriptional regulator
MSSERGKATRDKLVSAGRQLFGERGYEPTSIDAILDLAGVKRGALYHHFESKQALFDAVLERVVSDVAQTLTEAARTQPTPLERLRAGCAGWLETALDPTIQRIALLDAPAVVGWTRWREVDEQHILGGVRLSLQQIADDGRLPARDVDLLAHMVVAAVNETALLIARAPDSRDALARGQAAVDTLLDRLVADPSVS